MKLQCTRNLVDELSKKVDDIDIDEDVKESLKEQMEELKAHQMRLYNLGMNIWNGSNAVLWRSGQLTHEERKEFLKKFEKMREDRYRYDYH